MIAYFSSSASPFMKYTLSRNHAGVSENVQLEIWCHLGKHPPLSTPILNQMAHSFIQIFEDSHHVPGLVLNKIHILAGKVDTVNYTINAFILIKQFRIICKLIWGLYWSNLGKKGEELRSRQNSMSNSLEVGRSKRLKLSNTRMQRGRKNTSDKIGKEAGGQYWKGLSANEEF